MDGEAKAMREMNVIEYVKEIEKTTNQLEKKAKRIQRSLFEEYEDAKKETFEGKDCSEKEYKKRNGLNVSLSRTLNSSKKVEETIDKILEIL